MAPITQRQLTKAASAASCKLVAACSQRDSALRWYVIQTKPRQEDRAQHFLSEKGFEAYLPKMEMVNVRKNRRALTQKALFPSYLFTRFEQQESLAHVRWTKGVVKIDGVVEGNVHAERQVLVSKGGTETAMLSPKRPSLAAP